MYFHFVDSTHSILGIHASSYRIIDWSSWPVTERMRAGYPTVQPTYTTTISGSCGKKILQSSIHGNTKDNISIQLVDQERIL